jgi:DNA-binding transcriptional ArsR family regulator
VAVVLKPEQIDCIAPDRTPQELVALQRILASNRDRLRRASAHFALLAGETRLKILAVLRHSGELCVCDLATVLEMTPAAVSQHLSRLRAGGLVQARRDGMSTFYRCCGSSGTPPAVPVLTGEEG